MVRGAAHITHGRWTSASSWVTSEGTGRCPQGDRRRQDRHAQVGSVSRENVEVEGLGLFPRERPCAWHLLNRGKGVVIHDERFIDVGIE